MTQQRTGRRHMIIWWTFGALALAAAPSWAAWPGGETVKGNGKSASQARQLTHFTTRLGGSGSVRLGGNTRQLSVSIGGVGSGGPKRLGPAPR